MSMRRTASFIAFFAILTLALSAGAGASRQEQGGQANAEGFVYADFENAQDKRPVSSRGGFVQLISYEETTKSRFKGLADANPAAPELVRLKPDDPNHAIAFDYELYSPNQYAGVGVEVHGQPDKDGKPAPDDLSAYKFLSMQVYATGVNSLRVEIISRGQGIGLTSGFPQMAFKIKPGFNTYRIPLSSLNQPRWVDTKVGPKDVLKKLTAVSLTAFCEQCTPVRGTVVVDNLVFQK